MMGSERRPRIPMRFRFARSTDADAAKARVPISSSRNASSAFSDRRASSAEAIRPDSGRVSRATPMTMSTASRQEVVFQNCSSLPYRAGSDCT